MPARHEQRQIGKRHRAGQPRRQRMARQMVDTDEREPARRRQTLGEHHAGKHAADQTGAGGDRDGVDVVERRAGRGQRRPGDDVEPFGMGAGRDLGHDAAIGRVQALLTHDLGGKDRADRRARRCAHQRRRGVVAAALDPEQKAVARHGGVRWLHPIASGPGRR